MWELLFRKLEREGTVDEEVTEPLSMDWRLAQELHPAALAALDGQPDFQPRKAELVLFVPGLKLEEVLNLDPTGRVFRRRVRCED